MALLNDHLSELLRWLTLTHSVAWQVHYHSTRSGHVCENRFKAFPVEIDRYFSTALPPH